MCVRIVIKFFIQKILKIICKAYVKILISKAIINSSEKQVPIRKEIEMKSKFHFAKKTHDEKQILKYIYLKKALWEFQNTGGNNTFIYTPQGSNETLFRSQIIFLF